MESQGMSVCVLSDSFTVTVLIEKARGIGRERDQSPVDTTVLVYWYSNVRTEIAAE